MITHIDKGAAGEKYTAKHLKKLGFKILEKNMRNSFSEIDIIAQNREYIVFVEVKTRTEGQRISPSASVDRKKQEKIIKAAVSYIKFKKILKQPRFDVAEVFLCEDSLKLSRINYIENAFGQEGVYASF